MSSIEKYTVFLQSAVTLINLGGVAAAEGVKIIGAIRAQTGMTNEQIADHAKNLNIIDAEKIAGL